ncbi:MAG TPA: FeoB small GTPase domain-containing protein [Symbiobacteriaceae bacterium]|nr:FeoB small GTPase domain-containing protein [Symbiobacteriaceae bacterium]
MAKKRSAAAHCAPGVSMGIDLQESIPVIALAGNPNTGKTTLFNRLTGMRQHTGNWPGKTVVRAEGDTTIGSKIFRVIDLPGTYTLSAASAEERVAREFICFGRPDVTLVVADATALERNLSLVLQAMEITPKVVLCVNLIDEAHRKGIDVNTAKLQQRLGIPVVATSARTGAGVPELLDAVEAVYSGQIQPTPFQVRYSPGIEEAVEDLLPMIADRVGDRANARWIALKLVEGDRSIAAALQEHFGQVDLPLLTHLDPGMEATS